jgi:glutathione S-transferase
MDRMSDLYYNEPVTELLFQHMGFRAKDDERAGRARKYVETTYSFWDTRLASQPWMCGADFSMADCAAIPAMHYAQFVAPFKTHPNVVAYWQRAQQRPSYQKVKAEFEPMWEGKQAQRKAS